MEFHADPSLCRRVIQVPNSLGRKEHMTWDSVWHLAIVELDAGGLALQSLGTGIVSEELSALELIATICGMPLAEEAVYDACDNDPIGGKHQAAV